jgi:phage shock protein PspC (stress-responsive transcriptional regulator)
MHYGFTATLMLGLLAYVIGALVVPRLNEKQGPAAASANSAPAAAA